MNREQEKKDLDEKHIVQLNTMESQKAQAIDEIEELKASNKALQDEITLAKNTEEQLHKKADNLTKNSIPDQLKYINDPTKFVEAARYLNVNDLTWIYSQLEFMMNSTIRPQNLPGPYPMQPIYSGNPYYAYPMMPMYDRRPYQGQTED